MLFLQKTSEGKNKIFAMPMAMPIPMTMLIKRFPNGFWTDNFVATLIVLTILSSRTYSQVAVEMP